MKGTASLAKEAGMERSGIRDKVSKITLRCIPATDMDPRSGTISKQTSPARRTGPAERFDARQFFAF